jgi:hypothetical protein
MALAPRLGRAGAVRLRGAHHCARLPLCAPTVCGSYMAFFRVDRRSRRWPARTRRTAIAGAALVGLCALGVTACEDAPTGPSLSNVSLQGLALNSTTGNPGLCCCRVVGTARNGNSVPVHVTIKFDAANPSSPTEPLSTILFFIKDLQPGASAPIDASGFIFPCATLSNDIRNVRTEIEVKGITFPPG